MARSRIVKQALRAAGAQSRAGIRAAFDHLAAFSRAVEGEQHLSRLRKVTSLSEMRDHLADVGGTNAYRMTPSQVRRAFAGLVKR